MSYDALLLDYDGVVVDVMTRSERLPAFRERLRRQFRDERLEFDDSITETLVHSVSASELQALSDRTGLSPEQLWQHRDTAIADVFRDAAREGEKTPYDDVSAIRDLSAPIGIVSNNQQRVVESLSEDFGLDDQFETIHARDPHPRSLDRKKPEPTYIEDAMRELPAENPLFVGDKETDILAGRRAGVDTTLIRRDHNFDRRIDTQPTYEVETLETVAELLDSEEPEE